jgi:hypothetical protein
VAEEDGLIDAEHVAEAGDVVDPRVEVPAVGSALVAASLTAVVEEDELGDVGERREAGAERVVVETGPAMQEDHRRPLAQCRPLGNESLTDHLEVDTGVADANAHRATVEGLRLRAC